MFGKANKPSPIDSLIGAGTVIEGNITCVGGLRIDGHVKGNVKATGNKPGTLVLSELAKVEGEIDVAHIVVNGTVAGANGELDLYLFGWSTNYLHPDNFFNPILCDGYLAFGPKDTELCNQVQASRAEFNFNNQLTQYQWASRRVYDTLPLLPLAHTRTALVIRREILGLSASPMATEAYKDATLATAWFYLPLVRK